MSSETPGDGDGMRNDETPMVNVGGEREGRRKKETVGVGPLFL